MKHGWIFLTMLIAAGGCSAAPHCSGKPSEECTRILFLGNSYTFANDLPGTFAGLAGSGSHRVETETLAQGGWTLADHVNDKNTQVKIRSVKWDYVVLQEQSEIPAIPGSRAVSMYPAARTLVGMIEASGVTPIFFMTWARRKGDEAYGYNDFESMQSQIIVGYLTIANELGVAVAPVGYAWWTSRKQHPEIDLWQSDGSHPNGYGTYLAACVFYAVIFRQSPEGLAFAGGLPATIARKLQQVAAQVVLDHPRKWYLR